ncbi:MAG: thioesterase family protein [Actinobacteria bacterium]|nr:thioesterase family protein [Actinomycetota bacterium]MCB9412453.1 thioesterase family protein [Actinomycetota bacterium]
MSPDAPLSSESHAGVAACYRPVHTWESEVGEVVEEFASTEYAGSAWGPDMQHGGPVAALLVRAIDRCQPAVGTRISRIVVEILGPIPLTSVRTAARVVRPGRRVALLESDLWVVTRDGRWQLAAQARAWRLAASATEDVVNRADEWSWGDPSPEIEGLTDAGLPEEWRVGFVNALDWRIERSFGGPGTSLAWLRLAIPLVAGESTTPLEQCAAIADTANGVGARLDAQRFTYLNTDLTIHLFDAPTGSWIGLAAETSVGPDGLGLSSAVMLDAAVGPIGRVAQTLLVQRR